MRGEGIGRADGKKRGMAWKMEQGSGKQSGMEKEREVQGMKAVVSHGRKK